MLLPFLVLLTATLATPRPWFDPPQGQGHSRSLDQDDATAKNILFSKLSRERAQNHRKQEIQQRILAFVYGQYPSAVDSVVAQKGEKLAELFNNTSTLGTSVGRVQYLLPSCEVPQHADEDLWTSNGAMHLYFNMADVQPRPGHVLTISSAKLRLLKYAQGEAGEKGDECRDKQKEERREIGDEKVRVSVFNLTKPLKKNKPLKRKLLDSQMALTHVDTQMELDVKPTVRSWLSGVVRNFGLVVEAEDMDGNRKAASSFFRSRDCPSPSKTLEDYTFSGAQVTFPVLELALVETPENRNVERFLENSAMPSGGILKNQEEITEGDDTADDTNPRRQKHSHLDNGHHGRHGRHYSSSLRHVQPVVQPTLATVEDFDFSETQDDDDDDDDDDAQEEKEKENDQQEAPEQILHSLTHGHILHNVFHANLKKFV